MIPHKFKSSVWEQKMWLWQQLRASLTRQMVQWTSTFQRKYENGRRHRGPDARGHDLYCYGEQAKSSEPHIKIDRRGANGFSGVLTAASVEPGTRWPHFDGDIRRASQGYSLMQRGSSLQNRPHSRCVRDDASGRANINRVKQLCN